MDDREISSSGHAPGANSAMVVAHEEDCVIAMKALTKWLNEEVRPLVKSIEEKMSHLSDTILISSGSCSVSPYAQADLGARAHGKAGTKEGVVRSASEGTNLHRSASDGTTLMSSVASASNCVQSNQLSAKDGWSGKDTSSKTASIATLTSRRSIASRRSVATIVTNERRSQYLDGSVRGALSSASASPASPHDTGSSPLSGLFEGSLSLRRHRDRAMKMKLVQEAIGQYQNPRGKYAAEVWKFFENRYSSPLASIYAIFLPWFVVCSVLLSFWQTVDGCPLDGPSGDVLHTIFESLFALELIIRCIVCPDRWQFWHNPLNIIDLLSACPIVVRVVDAIRTASGHDDSAKHIISTIAIVPVLRLLKLTRRFEKFQILLSAVLIAIEALPVLLYSLVVIALLFSALIFFAEPEDNVESLPEALWFVLVTMTTVGYGDITPNTLWGHIVSMVLMLISGLFLAMPIGIVGNAFSQAWSARDRLLLMHRMREAFTQQGFSAKSLESIVKLFDGDADGELALDEFNEMLETMGIHWSPERVHLLLLDLDADGTGRITVEELMNGLFPKDYSDMFAGLKQATTKPSRSTVGDYYSASRSFDGSKAINSPDHSEINRQKYGHQNSPIIDGSMKEDSMSLAGYGSKSSKASKASRLTLRSLVSGRASLRESPTRGSMRSSAKLGRPGSVLNLVAPIEVNDPSDNCLISETSEAAAREEVLLEL